jgi:cytochrome c oxidase subunit 3
MVAQPVEIAHPAERSSEERHREAHDVTHGGHDDHGVLHHHFEDMTQQRESTSLGMWAFLCTEVMMFGALLFAYTLYRHFFYPAFAAGSHHLDITMGTINTFVLLFSSLTMALAVRCAQLKMKKGLVGWLVATMVFGVLFLGIKAVEWKHDYDVGLIPAINWNPGGEAGTHSSAEVAANSAHGAHGEGTAAGNKGKTEYSNYSTAGSVLYVDKNVGKVINKDNMQMYFVLYFCLTGLHAFHMIIGLGLVGTFTWMGWKGNFTNGNDQPVELLGLYWHFVDIVWIFLFPLLYLVGGHHVA